MPTPLRITDTADCAERVVAHCRGVLRLATPLGLGKPNGLLNALYRRVRSDTACSMTLYTALSLTRPRPAAGLEARFVEPFLERHFGADYEDLEYVQALAADRLPANVRVHEFYLQSGALLGSTQAQRDYVSQNYTHVARDLVARDINVIVQLVAARETGGAIRYSLASNPDVTLDLLDAIETAGKPRPLMVAVVHPQMPFLGQGAEVGGELFDLVLEPPASPRLFALPHEPVDLAGHAIGLHASALVRDGGTLQIGIGALSDALVQALLLRQQDNERYREGLRALDREGATQRLADACGGLAPFASGLYGASEMVMDGFMHLRRAGILKRLAYDDERLERAVSTGQVGERLEAGCVERLWQAGVLPEIVDAAELERLCRFGLLPPDACLRDGQLVLGEGDVLSADLRDPGVRGRLDECLRGCRLRHGRYLRGAFFLGSADLYDWLRGLQGEEWSGLDMTRVSDVNQLYGGREALDRLQRRDARFFNICMMATLLGDIVSDALADGRVVSGVGGQYNFVAMAHALHEGRSILLLRSTRRSHGRVESNVRWNYGHTTIPRHLRDIVVTEYGVADLRGRSDEDCIKAMLAITDARFLDQLADTARRAGKLAHDFRVPAAWRRNTPEQLRRELSPLRDAGLLPAFPLGTDFTAVEQQLLPALGWLRERADSWRGRMRLVAALGAPGAPVAGEEAALARMRLDRSGHPAQRLQRRLLQAALRRAARDS